MLLGQCIQDFTTSYGLPFSMVLAGLVGGVTHCAGMCSPFVLAQVGGEPQIKKVSNLLLPYHLGRSTTYIMLAVLVHSFINLAFVFSDTKGLIAAPLLMLAGVIFLVSAFPQLSIIFPWVNKIAVKMPISMKWISYLAQGSNPLKRYGLGVLLGFMPCGLVVSALMASATAPSVYHAAAAMGAFAVGTMPTLMAISFGGQALKQKYPKMLNQLSRGAMAISAVWLFALAGTIVF